MFKHCRFPVEMILLCSLIQQVRDQLRDLVEMQERGVEVDPSTIVRWVHRYAPELENKYEPTKATARVPGEWTRLKVGGRWK